MRKFIRNNSKKLLAVITVFLMVAWALPAGMKRGNEYMNARRVFGTAGDQKVFDADINRAKQQWEFLSDTVMLSPERTNGQQVPLLMALSRDPMMNQLAGEISQHPELYYLLQLEADRMGVMISDEEIESFFKQAGLAVRLNSTNRPIVELDDVPDQELKNAAVDSVGAFIKVQQAFRMAMNASKVSRPLRELAVSQELQQIELACVELSANDFLAQVSPPTEEQFKAQFDKFADIEAGQTSEQNPHGFGYKYPNRVTLQTVGVRKADVVAVVRATQTEDKWDVDARRFYLKHRDEFPAPPPTTNPASLPSTMPALAAAPTTQPYDAVKDKILDALMAPDVKKKFDETTGIVKLRLESDWSAWSTSRGKDLAATQTAATQTAATQTAATQVAATQTAAAQISAGQYPSFEYLQKLAADVQKQTGVLPVISSIDQKQTASDLEKLPGIGSAIWNRLPFAQYATELAADFAAPDKSSQAPYVQLGQPSQPMTDALGSIYFFRISQAFPAAKPASISEVADNVLRDFKIAAAYKLAKDKAQALLDAAIKDQSLAHAADGEKLKLINTGKFGYASPTIEHLDLDPTAIERFRVLAFELVSMAATQPTPPPMRLIELPVQMKIEVAQLLSAKPSADLAVQPWIASMKADQVAQAMDFPIMQTWFNFDATAARLKWKEDDTHKTKPRQGE